MEKTIRTKMSCTHMSYITWTGNRSVNKTLQPFPRNLVKSSYRIHLSCTENFIVLLNQTTHTLECACEAFYDQSTGRYEIEFQLRNQKCVVKVDNTCRKIHFSSSLALNITFCSISCSDWVISGGWNIGQQIISWVELMRRSPTIQLSMTILAISHRWVHGNEIFVLLMN